ncbi:MAG: acyl-CoA thioesterase domain-containing protein, partial [Pseudomonadota bacterium]
MSDTPLSSPERLVDGLVRLLSVEPGGADVCLGSPQKDGLGRVFGGQVLAQALQSAQASVTGSATGDATSDKAAHSLHAYFLRGGAEGKPIEYRIARDFDGNSFANRRVVASQQTEEGDWQPILNLTASFQGREDGLEHCEAPMPDIAPPEALKPDSEVRREVAERMSAHLSDNQRTLMLRPRPIEMRTVDRLHWMNTDPQPPRAHTWFRTV